MAIYRAKPGKEAELVHVIEEHWPRSGSSTCVIPDLHLLFRAEDEPGKTMFVNIITWRKPRHGRITRRRRSKRSGPRLGRSPKHAAVTSRSSSPRSRQLPLL